MLEITPSDYTVFVNNIPKDYIYENGIENALKYFFENEFDKDCSIQVASINLIYEIESVMVLREERTHLINLKK